MNDAKALYLDLLRKSVLEDLYVENEIRLIYLRRCLRGEEQFDESVLLDIRRHRAAMCQEYISLREVGINYGRTLQNLGFQHTMVGQRRLENVEWCLQQVVANQVPGDAIECGVWRGGAVVFMKGFLTAYNETARRVWVADSFRGLPPPRLKQDEGLDLSSDRYPMLAVDLETVQDLFRRYGLLDEQVKFLEGWFSDTLPTAPISALALLRVDGDLYESTMDCLNSLYHKLSRGGFVIIDDYGVLPQCREAVIDFRKARQISEPLQKIDWSGVFWRRED
jgi:O-methyltransferase